MPIELMMKLGSVIIILAIMCLPGAIAAECLNKFCLDTPSKTQTCYSSPHHKALLVDFWTSWCPNCRVSLDWLGGISKKYSSADLSVIAINLDEDRADAEPLFKEISSSVEILIDSEGKTAEQCSLDGIPATVLIDKDGRLIKKWRGSSEEIHQEINQELEKLMRSNG